jgi:hypothetical protein
MARAVLRSAPLSNRAQPLAGSGCPGRQPTPATDQGYTVTQFRLMEEAWDYAIVLDACRFDYFERLWKRYFARGELIKATSVGSSTVGWRDRTFTDYYDDVVYVSANPYIASTRCVEGFVGNRHFRKVHDVWLYGWDYEKGTVRPETVTEAARDAVAEAPAARVITHYLQPHAPYLDLDVSSAGYPQPEPESGHILEGVRANGNESWTSRTAVKVLSAGLRRVRLGGTPPEWRFREWFGMDPASPMDAVRRACGTEGLRRAYERNLELVLEHVRRLAGALSGRVIVTADHGELLGEGGCFSHHRESSNPFLLEIPLLVIDGARAAEPERETARAAQEKPRPPPDPRQGRGSQEAVTERLKALGYLA